jgi:hypothetical protein
MHAQGFELGSDTSPVFLLNMSVAVGLHCFTSASVRLYCAIVKMDLIKRDSL